MREIILICLMTGLAGCGGLVGGPAANSADTSKPANAANTTAAPPAKTSEPYAMHSAPKLIELVEKYPDSITESLGGKDIIVIGKVFLTDTSGIYFNSYSKSVLCGMSADARTDKKFADVETAARKSENPIVEVRGTFAEGSVSSSGSSAKLTDCTITSIGGTPSY